MSRAPIGGSIFYVGDARLTGAVRAAEVLAARLHAVADDGDLTVLTMWGERLDRTLERIEDVRGSTDRDFERLVVRVAAAFTGLHPYLIVQPVRRARMERGLLPM